MPWGACSGRRDSKILTFALVSFQGVTSPFSAWVIAVPILGLGAPVVVVMAGMPSGAMVYLFGARYETASDVAVGTVVVASAASVVTLSILLVLMGA